MVSLAHVESLVAGASARVTAVGPRERCAHLRDGPSHRTTSVTARMADPPRRHEEIQFVGPAGFEPAASSLSGMIKEIWRHWRCGDISCVTADNVPHWFASFLDVSRSPVDAMWTRASLIARGAPRDPCSYAVLGGLACRDKSAESLVFRAILPLIVFCHFSCLRPLRSRCDPTRARRYSAVADMLYTPMAP